MADFQKSNFSHAKYYPDPPHAALFKAEFPVRDQHGTLVFFFKSTFRLGDGFNRESPECASLREGQADIDCDQVVFYAEV